MGATSSVGARVVAVDRVWALLPVKAFADAKVRLAPAMNAADRAALARTMAEHVLTAAHADQLPIAVVCDDPGVAVWAAEHGALVIPEDRPGRGLNGAVQRGVVHLVTRERATQVIVAHADLPFASRLAWVAAFPEVTLVPDRREDGTNVICLPAKAAPDFRFAYGAGSFNQHRAEARRLGFALRTVRDPLLGWDIDLPADLVNVTQPA